MQAQPFKSRSLVDYLYDFSKGVNNGVSYALLPKDQLSSAVNATVRGTFIGPRPRFRKITLATEGYAAAAALAVFAAGRYQGGCYYNPDSGLQSLIASVSGRLYRFAISGTTATLSDITVAGDPNSADQPRAWLWQAEKWVIATDGSAQNPVFYNGNISRRSNYAASIAHTARDAAGFVVPAIGAEIAAPLVFDNVDGLEAGVVVTHQYRGRFMVVAVAGFNVTLLNLTATPEGYTVPPPARAYWSWYTLGQELPPGRMGVYGMGRVWMSLVDGKQFIAGDLTGGSSGTVAENFRDAVLQCTENLYLAGGGNFAVPGSYGEIRAMRFSETLDTSLGQGALQVFTPYTVFSCNAPVDRTTWQNMENPILTESAKGGGGLSQWSTINSNSDIISRTFDGIRSLMLTRREFNTWGNVPISREVQHQLDRDSPDLLGYTSAVSFDNRFLLTTEGEPIEGRGVIWKRIIPINHDTVSSLQGKTGSIYDSLYWQGLNVFQLLKGEFDNEERCFAFTLNRITNEIELWEILRSSNAAIYDDVDTRVLWSYESGILDFGQKDPRVRERLRLGEAEISISDLKGRVTFQAFFKPENWPFWVPWATWEECVLNTATGNKPSFRPNMGLPEPSPLWCDEQNKRPLREGYFFQFKLVVMGQCKVTSVKFSANTVPQPPIAPPVCTSICPATT